MNDQPRGRHFIAADRGFATGGGFAARGCSPAASTHLLDRIDAGLAEGRMEATLPDGSVAQLRRAAAPGPHAVVHHTAGRRSSASSPRARSAGTRPGSRANGPAPIRSPLFELFSRNAERLGNTGRAKGLFRLVNRIAHRIRANDKDGSRRNIAYHYDLGNDFYAAWLDRRDDLFERDLRRADRRAPSRSRRRSSARSACCSTGST